MASIRGSVNENESIIRVAIGSKFVTIKKASPVINTIKGVMIAAAFQPSFRTILEPSRTNIMVKIPVYFR